MKPQEGDYCKLNQVILYKNDKGKLLCDKCSVRCKYSSDKEEKDYLIRKK